MKHAAPVTLLAMTLLSVAQAQDVQDDDVLYDGSSLWDYDPQRDDQRRGGEPTSIEEARRMGKAYRVGAGYRRDAVPDYYTVQRGDTLWDITQRFYGDPWRWPQVWSYNPEITNPHWIYPLDRVRLRAERTEPSLELPEDERRPGRAPRERFQPGTVFLRDQGYLDGDALAQAGRIVAAPEEQMLLANSDEVYVQFEPGQKVKAGRSYNVFRTMRPSERHPKEQGTLVRVFGTLVIGSYDREQGIARARVTEALDPIERGFKVAPVQRRFVLVSPKKNTNNAQAKIIASIRPREVLSYNNVVFLDVGAGKGIEPGNRFFVVRQGDPWHESITTSPDKMGAIVPVPAYEEEKLPDEVIAELRVLKVQEKITVALVTSSRREIAIGDRAIMRRGF